MEPCRDCYERSQTSLGDAASIPNQEQGCLVQASISMSVAVGTAFIDNFATRLELARGSHVSLVRRGSRDSNGPLRPQNGTQEPLLPQFPAESSWSWSRSDYAPSEGSNFESGYMLLGCPSPHPHDDEVSADADSQIAALDIETSDTARQAVEMGLRLKPKGQHPSAELSSSSIKESHPVWHSDLSYEREKELCYSGGMWATEVMSEVASPVTEMSPHHHPNTFDDEAADAAEGQFTTRSAKEDAMSKMLALASSYNETLEALSKDVDQMNETLRLVEARLDLTWKSSKPQLDARSEYFAETRETSPREEMNLTSRAQREETMLRRKKEARAYLQDQDLESLGDPMDVVK